jgi:hypothetical protein
MYQGTDFQSLCQAVVPNNGYAYTESEFDASHKYDSFTVSFGGARPPKDLELVPGGSARQISYNTRKEYVRLAKIAHLRKYDANIRVLRKGLLQYIPCAILALWNGYDLEEAVTGENDIPVDKLRDEVEDSLEGNIKVWFWVCVSKLPVQQRSKLLLFATGRSRLPVGKFYIREAVAKEGADANCDGALPAANTCAFELRVPKYSSEEVMMAQLTKALDEFRP